MHPFELAVVADEHSRASYLNAVEQGSVEYLQKYRHVCKDFGFMLSVAASAGQLDSIRLLNKLGFKNHRLHALDAVWWETMMVAIYAAAGSEQLAEININDAFCDATNAGQLQTMRVLVKIGNVTYLNTALYCAIARNLFDAVELLIELGATAIDHAIIVAESYARREMVVLLNYKNQLC